MGREHAPGPIEHRRLKDVIFWISGWEKTSQGTTRETLMERLHRGLVAESVCGEIGNSSESGVLLGRIGDRPCRHLSLSIRGQCGGELAATRGIRKRSDTKPRCCCYTGYTCLSSRWPRDEKPIG